MIRYKYTIFAILLIFTSLINLSAASNEDFFGLEQNQQDINEEKKSSSDTEIVIPETAIDDTITDIDKVAIRANSHIFTEREVNIFFALKQLSPFLYQSNTMDDFQKKLASLLILEDYINQNKLYRMQPTSKDIKSKVDFLNSQLGTDSLLMSVSKMDSTGQLTVSHIRKFFYYTSLREKIFVYLLQSDFLKKMLPLREDEKIFLYRALKKANPKIFTGSSSLYLLNMTAYKPKKKSVSNQFLSNLQEKTSIILDEPNLKKRRKLFHQFIKRYTIKKYMKIKVVGPIDEKLAVRDFPEYIPLFKLKKGDISDPIIKNGFIRIIFINDVVEGKKQSVNDPNVQSRLGNILYENKAQNLFDNFIADIMNKADVTYY